MLRRCATLNRVGILGGEELAHNWGRLHGIHQIPQTDICALNFSL